MRSFALAILFAAGPALAETDPATIKLSPTMELVVSYGVDGAAAQLWRKFKPFSSDEETVVFAEMGGALAKDLAEKRAQKVYLYLAIDLNWDGRVTRDELEQVFDTPETAPFVDGWLTDGDIDGDGVITLQEMHADAKRDQTDVSGPSDLFMREMMGWDLNGDGILHFDEVLSVIDAHQK